MPNWPIGYSWPAGYPWPIPPPPPGVVLWLDGRSQTYSDTAATVQANAYTGRVRRINYPAPLSGNIQAPSDPVRPWREPNALNFQFGAQHSLAATATSATTWNACTIAIAFRPRLFGQSSTLGLIANSLVGSAGGLGVRLSNANLVSIDSADSWTVARPEDAGLPFPNNNANVPAGHRAELTIRTNPAGIRVSVVVDGARIDYTHAIALGAAASTANWTIGSDVLYATRGSHAVISQAIVVAREVTDSENDNLLAGLAANQAPDFPASLPLVVVSGDSIAFGLNLDRSLTWSFKAQQSIETATPLAPINMLNVAVSGDTIQSQQDDYPTTMAPFFNPLRARNIFVGAVGTNNMANIGQDGPTALAAYYAYLDDKLARGWKVVACSVLPRNAGAAFNTARAYFNSHLRAEWAARGYSAIADVALVPGMGADGDDANLTNYQDNIHPTLVGNDLLEPTYRAAIQTAAA